jgi:hypothetical protein
LLLGGKNLIPLVSAAIIEGLSWRWVFWIVAIIVGMCLVLLFFFVPETFWDRTPRPRVHKSKSPRITGHSVSDLISHGFRGRRPHVQPQDESADQPHPDPELAPKKSKHTHVGFADDQEDRTEAVETEKSDFISGTGQSTNGDQITTQPPTPANEKGDDFLQPLPQALVPGAHPDDIESARPAALSPARTESLEPAGTPLTATLQYTNRLRERPKIPYTQLLRVWNGRIAQDSWYRVAVRPFVLFAYPSVLWSTVVYSLSVGWLIVLSESVAHIFEGKAHYNFTALQTGLIYISPFVGGLLGTAVAGKVSDIIARFMTRRNGGIYEPEFRLVMALPIALSTVIGLMAFGWSAENGDSWIVPTIFFGLISFGCCLGSTTAITFCVDSYRQYAGEALVTLNFSKSMLAYPSFLSVLSDLTLLLFQTSSTAWFSPFSSWTGSMLMAHAPSSWLSAVYSFSSCSCPFPCTCTANELVCGRYASDSWSAFDLSLNICGVSFALHFLFFCDYVYLGRPPLFGLFWIFL